MKDFYQRNKDKIFWSLISAFVTGSIMFTVWTFTIATVLQSSKDDAKYVDGLREREIPQIFTQLTMLKDVDNRMILKDTLRSLDMQRVLSALEQNNKKFDKLISDVDEIKKKVHINNMVGFN